MARISTVLLAALALAGGAATTHAQATCAGDCSGDHTVAINELVICVNIDLGSAMLSTCTACDANGDGSVGISDLVGAVNNALNGCTPGTGGYCGDGKVNVDGEECDDGNNLGGDGCAANCTNEVRRETTLDSTKSLTTIQLSALPIPLHVTGQQFLTAGKARSTAVMGADGKVLFQPMQIPLTVKTADVQFDPVPISGLFCACVRASDVPEFGPGNAGIGVVGCGPDGLTDVDYKVEQDHDTTPDSPKFNSGPDHGLPDDPQCNAHSDAGGQVISDACLEGVGAACSGDTNEHVAIPSGPNKRAAACNSPRVYTFSGGQAPRGSTILRTRTASGVLNNASSTPCVATKDVHGVCSAPDFGPDCLPCTDDDLQQGTPTVGVSTSGTASVIIYDTGDTAGALLGDGAMCGGTPCIGKVTGAVSDCDALINDPNAPLKGALVSASPMVDSSSGDVVVTTTLVGQTQ